MSAYIVNREHIDYLVTAAVRLTGLTAGTLAVSKIGQALIDENIASVQDRYPGHELADLPGPVDTSDLVAYRFRPSPLPVAPHHVLKAIHGYIYQSCEHRAWGDSAANRFCVALIAAAEAMLPPSELQPVPSYPGSTRTCPRYQTRGDYESSPFWDVSASLEIAYARKAA